eukprot:816908-Rhodomonas_salina.1
MALFDTAHEKPIPLQLDGMFESAGIVGDTPDATAFGTKHCMLAVAGGENVSAGGAQACGQAHFAPLAADGGPVDDCIDRGCAHARGLPAALREPAGTPRQVLGEDAADRQGCPVPDEQVPGAAPESSRRVSDADALAGPQELCRPDAGCDSAEHPGGLRHCGGGRGAAHHQQDPRDVLEARGPDDGAACDAAHAPRGERRRVGELDSGSHPVRQHGGAGAGPQRHQPLQHRAARPRCPARQRPLSDRIRPPRHPRRHQQ